jgi:hypothetical protein
MIAHPPSGWDGALLDCWNVEAFCPEEVLGGAPASAIEPVSNTDSPMSAILKSAKRAIELIRLRIPKTFRGCFYTH